MKLNKRLLDYSLNPIAYPLDIPEWVKLSHKDFILTITSKAIPRFPCFFAEKSYLQKSMFFTYLDSDEIYPSSILSSNLEDFLNCLTSTEKEFPVLIVFVNTDNNKAELDYYEKRFWDIVNGLIQNDPAKEYIDKDTTNPDWTLNFNKTPIFINGHSNAYFKRKSRKSFCDLMLVIQSYDNLMKLQDEQNNISKKIRKNTLEYDQMPISKVFGNHFFDTDCLDWRLFWLTDEDDTIDLTKKCPIRYEKKIP